MSFASALDHLHALGAELAAPSAPRRKFDLAHMRTLIHALGDPQLRFRSILIAGTNGKGSTAATLAHILAAAGLRTALYTSPHLTRITERIRTNTLNPANAPSGSVILSEAKDPRISAPAERSRMGQLTTTLQEIPEPTFARLFFQVDECAQRLISTGELPHLPSYFETLTALALLYFAEQRIDLAVLEVGLGGRLDATNIVDPLLSVITDIALDHQDYLGPTIRDIAREKAGILRPNGILITLPQHPEANQAIGEAAVPLNVRAINAADFLPGRNFPPPEPSAAPKPSTPPTSRHSGAELQNPTISPAASTAACRSERSEEPPHLDLQPDPSQSDESLRFTSLTPNHYTLHLDRQPLHIASPLPGEHQQRNLALAIATAVELRTHHGYHIPNSAIESGIANTRWPGRLEFLPPNLLLDVAHNPAGAWTLRAALARLPESRPRTLIFSCLRDKDLREIAQILFPLFDSSAARPQHHIILTSIDSPRATTLDQLLAAAHALNIPAQTASTPADALALARSITPPHGMIVATGSIYLIGTLRAIATNVAL